MESSTRLGGFRALKKTTEAPYTTKVNYREHTSRGTTLWHFFALFAPLSPSPITLLPFFWRGTLWTRMFRQAGHTPPHQRVARRDENKNLLVGEPCSASRLSLSWPKLLCVLSPLGLACVCGAARAPRAPRARRRAAPARGPRRPFENGHFLVLASWCCARPVFWRGVPLARAA